MSSPQPERHPSHAAPAAGQTVPADVHRETLRGLMAAVDEIPTSYINSDPDVPSWKEGGRIGDAAPVEQPGAPSMTRRETQIGRVALCVGAGVSLPILSGAVLLVATEHANPAVIAWGAIGVGSLTVLVAALGYLVKRIMSAAPPEIHNHIAGDSYQDQRNVRTKTNAIWAKTNINP